MATRKQTALALAASLGADQPVIDAFDDIVTVDFWAPTGKRWVANGEHATQDREATLTECWRSAIATMRQGLEDCDCGDCGYTLGEEATVVEQTDEVAPTSTSAPAEEPLVTIHEVTCGGSTYNLWVHGDGSVRLYTLDGLPLSPHFSSVDDLKRWNGGQGFKYVA